MTPIESLGQYSPVGDILTCVMVLILLLVIRSVSVKAEYNYKAFSTIFILLFVGANANIAFYLMATDAWHNDKALLYYLARDIYHICLLLSLHIILCYVMSVVAIEESKKAKWRMGSFVFLAAIIILDVTKFGFYITSDGLWYDNYILHPYTIAFAVYYTTFFLLAIIYRNFLFKNVVRIMVCVEAFCVVIMIMQTLFHHNSFSAFLFLVPIISMTLLLHVNSYDINIGTLGEPSLVEYIERRKGTRKVYAIMFNNYTYRKGKKARLYFCNFYKKYLRNVDTFFIEGNTLIIIAKPVLSYEQDFEFLKDSIQGFTERDLKCAGVMFMQHFPEGVKDFKFNLEYSKLKAIPGKAYVLTEDDGKEIIKRRKVYYELKDIDVNKDMDDKRVQVYVQPVKNVKTGKFDTAEALMRLETEEYGIIMPNLFIPLAEKYKCIHTLSLIIFTKVCKAVRQFEDEGFELSRISVNFAMQEFKNPEFTKELLNIIKTVGIPNDKIAIEITESENDEEYELTQRIVDELKDLEIHMYLDDFGTGYSNFDRLFRLKLNVVKFDRSFLLMAKDNEKNVFLIKHFSSAFNQMGYEILYEGIETDEQEQLCMSSSADYLQGYKYSKPIPILELTRFLSKKEGVMNDN